MTTLGIIVGVLIIGLVGLRLAMPLLTGKSVATGIGSGTDPAILGDCPDTPNCQGSESSRAEQRVERFPVTQSPSQAIETLASIVKAQSGTTIIKQDERYLHATFATPVMAFVDDVEFLLSSDGNSVQVRSASRLGKSDLGANARRIDMLRELAAGTL